MWGSARPGRGLLRPAGPPQPPRLCCRGAALSHALALLWRPPSLPPQDCTCRSAASRGGNFVPLAVCCFFTGAPKQGCLAPGFYSSCGFRPRSFSLSSPGWLGGGRWEKQPPETPLLTGPRALLQGGGSPWTPCPLWDLTGAELGTPFLQTACIQLCPRC